MEVTIQNRRSIPDLPEDVFLLILDNIDLWDVCRFRRVSRAWKEAFEKEEYLSIMLHKYPRAREVQYRTQQSLTRDIFDKVASRYYHLAIGKTRSVEKYKLCASEQFSHWFPIAPWEYHESQPGGRLYYENATHISRLGGKPFLFRPTFWSYDDGLVVFAPGSRDTIPSNGKRQADNTNSELMLLDIDDRSFHAVPFDVDNKIIRNFRLKDRTLVIEWAEKLPFHALNETEQVHRHFATCFDVHSDHRDGDHGECRSWVVTMRNEFKIHFLGLPLTHRDRFFSTHNAYHYAIYFWQPNRSMYTGDEERPIESLFVWDMSNPSPYLPSADPTGKHSGDNGGPQIIERLVLGQLDWFGIRQHSDVSLMSLHLDSSTSSLTIRENVCIAGQGYFDPAERLSCAKTTTLLFQGQGPYLYREWDGNLPPYRGQCSMVSSFLSSSREWEMA